MHDLPPPNPEARSSRERRRRQPIPRIRLGRLADADHLPAEAGDENSPDGTTLDGAHGWLDADVDDELLATTADHLRHLQAAGGEPTWGITAIRGFHGYPVGPHEDLRLVATIARGIANHGPAFAAWAATRTNDITEDAFTAAFLGTYISVEAWAQRICRDLDLLSRAQTAVPDSFRDYVRIDYEGLARDAWLHERIRLLRRPRGGVWVFADL